MMNYRDIAVSLLLIGLLGLLFVGCAQRENPAIPQKPIAGVIYHSAHQYDGLTNLQDHDRALNANRGVAVYTPYGYSEGVNQNIGQRYPVLYLLPGYDGEPSFFYRFGNENYYQVSDVAAVADRLIAAGEIKPMLIVMPDASIPYGGAFYGDSSLDGPWEDMMAQELVDYIDRTFLTLHDQAGYEDKDFRAVSGHSSGGYGAMRLAMKYPDEFNSVSAIDAPLDFSDLQNYFSDFLTEAGITSEADYLANDSSGLRAEPYKILFYSMAATFSPSGVKDPNSAFGKMQIGLPFDYQGNMIDTIWTKWMNNDLFTWLDTPEYQTALENQHIYLENSNLDIKGFDTETKAFEQKLTSLGIPFTDASFTGYEGYSARSRSFLYDRLEYILKFHDKYLRDRNGQF